MQFATSYPGISFEWDFHHPMFKAIVEEDLARINDTPTGRMLLLQIGGSRPQVTSTVGSKQKSVRDINFPAGVNLIIVPADQDLYQSGYKSSISATESGSVTKTFEPSGFPQHNPQGRNFHSTTAAFTIAVDTEAATDGRGTISVIKYSNASMMSSGIGIMSPSFIILAHELVHAAHHIQGTKVDDGEEDRTIGIGRWIDQPMTPIVCENKIRSEAGLPFRTKY